MNIQTPIEQIEKQILDTQIKAQSKKWDVEKHFHKFEQAIDTLDVITDGLPDDPKLANVLIGLHERFCEIYSESKAQHLILE